MMNLAEYRSKNARLADFLPRVVLVDAERKADFEEAGSHFEPSYFLTTSGGIWIMPPIFAQVSALSDELNGLFWAADSASSVRAGGS